MGTTVAGRAPTQEAATGRGGAGPWLTLPRLWLVVVLGAIAVMELAQVPSAVDLAYHLKVGELIVAEWAVPRTDMLAWTTAGRPWLDQNWGAQVALYGIWQLGGFPLLTVVNALCAVAAWGLVAAACRRRTANKRQIAGAVLAGYATAAAAFSPRPQMFSMLLFAAELYLLEAARTRPRVALGIPFLMVVWANLHGAFAVGVALLLIEAAAVWWRDRPRAARYLLVTAASLAGLLMNPWGVRVLGYAISFPASQTVTGVVTEWGPATLRQPAGALILVAIGVLVVALVRAPSPERAPEQLLRMALLASLALWAIRAGAWFGLALPVAVCALACQEGPARSQGAERGVPVLSGLVLAVLAVTLVAASPPVARVLLGSRPELRDAPVAAATWLAANPQPGRMFNYQPWGSYLEFRLGPRVQVAFDSRIELPPTGQWSRYHAVITGRWDAERLLDQWRVGHLVTSRRGTPALVEQLEASGRWRLVFSRGDERVYLRVTGPGARPSPAVLPQRLAGPGAA